ncbi:uncharacterized protein FA14DRAFT_68372 [Meira miltonrushii]|uniref:Uncharacterized protein n=1 Tax=Meira miltonrushii TaxID=1280837 RepID=A0A316V916_9BASI|nr:uncharacterized protein FA14DRAFT_68372 [Meira miltonrushii]PWN34087.1 hypothetical protein FA14DRAFT_68372 [Meira miltonrushii]
MMEGVAKRAIELIGSANEKHVDFPASILTGLQSSSGASAQSLSELDKFIHGLFAFDLPKNFFIQMAVAGACIATLVLVGLATIYSRVTQRAFWIFKATRRSEGIYLVPNALNTFLLFEGVFAALWLAFIIIQYEGYWRQVDEIQKHIATFNLIIWWPLWIGAFMAGWGSFYTAPGALDKGPLRSNGLGKFLPRPLVINIFCIGTPLILIISLIPLIVLTQHHLNDAFGAYKIFRAQIASAIASAGSNPIAASPEQSLQFLSTANTIWDMQVKTGYYMAIGYAIWPVWAAIFLIFYMPAGGYLVYLVWGQLRRQKSLLIELREKYIEEEAIERRKRELAREDGLGPGNQVYRRLGTNSTGGAVAMRQIISLGEESAPHDPTSSLLFQPLTSSQERATTIAGPEAAPSPPVTPSTVVQGRTQLSHNHHSESNEQKRSNSTEGEEGQDVFFPPMKPEMQRRAGTKRLSSVGGTPYTRYKYLRRCFINLTVLYAAIVLGAALYLGVSASLARYLYKSYQKGPEDLAHIVYYTCVIAAWGAVVFGSACIAAIMARLIDPANGPNSSSRNVSDEKGAGGQGGFARRVVAANSPFTIRKKLSHSSSSPLQEKTRTLPAVPESVGATVDELMTGISIPAPVQHTRSIGAASSRYPRRMSSLDDGHLPVPPPMQNRALKFDMHPRPERGLILEPTAASSFAELGGEESSLWPENSGRTSTSSRFKQLKRKNNLKSINTTPTLPSDFPSSAVGSSNNSSQRSLPSRRKYSLTEPTAAPPPPPAKPLAPARTPPLSPQYMALIKDGKRGRRDDGLNEYKLDDEVAPVPPSKMGIARSRGDWHVDPSFTGLQHPLMHETSTSAPITMPDPHMALFSGLKFGAIPVQGADVSATQSDESDIETPMVNNSFSAHRKLQRDSKQDVPAPVTISNKASLSTVQTSPSVAVTPIMTRSSGLKSGVSPFASPTIGLPPTPTSATAFTTYHNAAGE